MRGGNLATRPGGPEPTCTGVVTLRACDAVILTVGHSNHAEGEFLELLRGAGVTALADVRVSPRSRYEHFNRGPLAGSLEAAGVHYVHLGEQLGGRREPRPDSPNGAWEEDAFRGYADHMASGEFNSGIERLEELAAGGCVAAMCAEGDWRQCHRRLISDALAVRGHHVLHLGPDGALAEHELTESAVIDGGRITYPAVQTSLDL
jgi:uncharacterized protein (DUF488 family)